MKAVVSLLVLAAAVAVTGGANAAPDAAAGKSKAEESCAACHGPLGVSVTDTIPNLAGQRAKYLENQLKALKSGTRKNDVMNAIATQLSAQDIENLAAHFSSQAPAGSDAKSPMLASLAKSPLVFPADFPGGFTKYHTINFPATGQVRYYLANQAAVAAAKAGKPIPDGAYMFVQVNSAKKDAAGQPITGADGFFEADKVLFYTAMAREAGWGKDIPANIRNEDWNYAIFTTAKEQRPGVNQAECLACHQPLDKTSYLFTLKQLTEVAKK